MSLYTACGFGSWFQKPKVIVVSSPFAMRQKLEEIGDSLGDPIHHEMAHETSQLFDSILENRTSREVREQIRSKSEEDWQIIASVASTVNAIVSLSRPDGINVPRDYQNFCSQYYGLLPECKFLQEQGVIDHNDGVINQKIEALCDMVDGGVYDVFLFKKGVIVCPFPSFMKTVGNTLHHPTEFAIGWSDGFKGYALWGVAFSSKQWMEYKAATVEKIFDCENTEQRRVLLKRLGPEELLKFPGVRLIDKVTVKRLPTLEDTMDGNYSERTLEYELYSINGLTPKTEKLMRYRCASTDRWYTKFVPPEFIKALDAIAWSHNMTSEEYAAVISQS